MRKNSLSFGLPLFAHALLLATPFLEVQGKDFCDRYDVDGCSIPGGLPFFFKSLFTPSCNRHDICYHCGISYDISRLRCDTVFLDNMKQSCRENYVERTSSGIDWDETSQQQHKTRVLDLLEKNHGKFADVLRGEMSAFQNSSPLHSKFDEFANAFMAAQGENVVGQWAGMLEDLMREEEATIADLESNIISGRSDNTESPGKLGSSLRFKFLGNSFPSQPRLKSRDHSLSGSSLGRLWYKVLNVVGKASRSLTRESLIFKGKDKTNSQLCQKILGRLQPRGIIQNLKTQLVCDDIQLLDCYFFADLYYLAVRIFGDSSYLRNPSFYCNESFVLQCLPEDDVN